MKTKFIALLIGFYSVQSFSQTDSIDYLGQTPPGTIPEKFAPGIISVPNRYEFGISFAPDGKEIFFTTQRPGDGLMRIVKNDSVWGSPEPANLRKGSYWEFEAFYKNQGDTLFFTSKTSENSGTPQFYYVIKDGENWGDATKLNSPVNDIRVMWCTFSKNGNMYYTDEQNEKVYFSKYVNGEYLAGEFLNNGMHPFIAPDESYFLYDNGGSIYIRFRNCEDNGWLNPVKLNSSINSSSYEGCPCLSPDGKYLFFSRYIDKSDIYWVNADFINELKHDAYEPKFLQQIPNFNIDADSSFSYKITEDVFSNGCAVDSIVFSASLSDGSPLPVWLSFNPELKQLSGVPDKAEIYNVKITANYGDSSKVSSDFSITVSPITSLNRTESTNIFVCPNPSNGIIRINTNTFLSQVYSYYIVDINGKTVKQGILESEFIDITSLKTGCYFLNLSANQQIISKKIVIK